MDGKGSKLYSGKVGVLPKTTSMSESDPGEETPSHKKGPRREMI